MSGIDWGKFLGHVGMAFVNNALRPRDEEPEEKPKRRRKRRTQRSENPAVAGAGFADDQPGAKPCCIRRRGDE